MTDTEKKMDTKLPQQPHYAVKNEKGWGKEMLGLYSIDAKDDLAGIFGTPIINFTMEAEGVTKFRVRNKRGIWLPYTDVFDISKGAGDDTPITGIEIVGSGFAYSIHAKGGAWLPIMNTTDTEGEVLAVAGSQIDALWIDKL